MAKVSPRPILVTEQASPSTPASGTGAIYFKTDGLAYYKNDAGTEFSLGVLTGQITHGATASTARPTGHPLVVWRGSVLPTNASAGDLLIYQPTGSEGYNAHSLWMRDVTPAASPCWMWLGGGPPGQGNLEGDPGQEISATPFSWTTFGTAASIAYSTDTARTGDQSLKLTNDGSAGSVICYKQNSVLIPVNVGDPITASAWVKPGSTARQFYVQLQWLDGSFANGVQYDSRPITEVSGAWVQAVTRGIAPQTGFVRVVYTWLSVAASEIHYLDDIRTEKGLTATGEDGSVPVLAVDAPADASLQNGAAGIYLDPTTGSPRLMAKAKDAAGTVFTLEVASRQSAADSAVLAWLAM
jgi:hypothetical protein